MNPFAVWLYWSRVWAEWSTLWWTAMAPSVPPPPTLSAEERGHLELLRLRFAAEVAERQSIPRENAQ